MHEDNKYDILEGKRNWFKAKADACNSIAMGFPGKLKTEKFLSNQFFVKKKELDKKILELKVQNVSLRTYLQQLQTKKNKKDQGTKNNMLFFVP